MALFEETDVLCVADREGGRVECVQAGLQKPLHANRDDTGRRVVNYNSRMIGKPYAIAAKGTALLVLRGSPGAKGLTIDTAAEPEEDPIIDEWGTSDVRIFSEFLKINTTQCLKITHKTPLQVYISIVNILNFRAKN